MTRALLAAALVVFAAAAPTANDIVIYRAVEQPNPARGTTPQPSHWYPSEIRLHEACGAPDAYDPPPAPRIVVVNA